MKLWNSAQASSPTRAESRRSGCGALSTMKKLMLCCWMISLQNNKEGPILLDRPRLSRLTARRVLWPLLNGPEWGNFLS